MFLGKKPFFMFFFSCFREKNFFSCFWENFLLKNFLRIRPSLLLFPRVMSGAPSSASFEEPSVLSRAEPSVRQSSAHVATRVAEPIREASTLRSLQDVGKECAAGGLYNQYLLLTYAQCELSPATALMYLGHSKIVTGLACCREVHADGNHHLHVFVQKKKTLLPWEMVLLPGGERTHRPNVRSLVTAQHRYNVWVYLHKEGGEVLLAKAFTVPPKPRSKGTPMSSSQDLLDVASNSSIETALSQYVSEGGDLARVGPVQRGLQLMLAGPPPGPRWEAETPRLELRPWQQLLLDFLNSRPERRRVFWVVGAPGSGKTTFSTWLEDPTNYEGGVLNLGSCTSVSNALHNYQNQACVVLDYPRSFRFDTHGDDVGQVCETFSEFGAARQSTKYIGRRVRILCHCVVLSNSMPITQVRHRDIQLIETANPSQASTLPMEAAETPPGRVLSPEACLRSRSRSPRREQ